MKTFTIILSLIVIPNLLLAEEQTTFREVWTQIKTQSPAIESSQLQKESYDVALERSQKHWLPRAYLDVRSFRTNDPGSNFFGLLEQRKVQNSDFNPNTLNSSDSNSFTKAAVGLDLALYEGGMKERQIEAYKFSSKSQSLMSSQIEVEQYAQVGLSYSSIATLKTQTEKLNAIAKELQQLIKSYQIGQKSNPVGYSGLLGMKSLLNRIQALQELYQSTQKAHFQSLKAMGFSKESWLPANLNAENFVKTYFSSSLTGDSQKVESLKEATKAQNEMAWMEKARYLPRVGAFAETFAFNGSRDTAQAYTAGLYLQWSLYDPNDSGKYKEAKLKTLSQEKQIQALSQQELAERDASRESIQAITQNLKLLKDSDQLLAEQMQVASQLFKNGSITALQLVEILNRRTDLITQQNDAELQLLKLSSNQITKTKFEIPAIAQKGDAQ